MALVSAQCRAARALLNWSQDDLARFARVTLDTLAAFEDGEAIPHAGERALAAALTAAGIVFIDDGAISDLGGVGVRLRDGALDEGLRPEELSSENDD
ncbi:helix-turn-helix domain-containing protein [Microvirga flavescens]|uniref:helix-turn-helix domain-containing protein n=1 Tax=Microvirga flavescens TaxID=2249811 RepID=UPI000DD62BB9|nr:helix-turn-helix transcriptional regulator [Microvirga flavescens]